MKNMTFGTEPQFWNKDDNEKPTVGDIINRPAVVELLEVQPGETGLDTGCGAGRMTRLFARQGARMYGVDLDEKLLAIAVNAEQADPRNIEYQLGNITGLPYPSSSFDFVTAVSVLMYISCKELSAFYQEVVRVLHQSGRLVIAVTHPHLYENNSIARDGGRGGKWITLEPVSDESDSGETEQFTQQYVDIHGRCSVQRTWNHSLTDYLNLAGEAGLMLEETREIRFPEQLTHGRQGNVWGHKFGYPAYLQLKFKKF